MTTCSNQQALLSCPKQELCLAEQELLQKLERRSPPALLRASHTVVAKLPHSEKLPQNRAGTSSSLLEEPPPCSVSGIRKAHSSETRTKTGAQTSPNSQAVFGPVPCLCHSAKPGRPFPPWPLPPREPHLDSRTRAVGSSWSGVRAGRASTQSLRPANPPVWTLRTSILRPKRPPRAT